MEEGIPESKIQSVMKILSAWNPLGKRSRNIEDLDGYRTEAIDILFHIDLLKLTEANTLRIVQEVLNEAFDLALSKSECIEPAKKIYDMLTKC
jgi:hypothetical protein